MSNIEHEMCGEFQKSPDLWGDTNGFQPHSGHSLSYGWTFVIPGATHTLHTVNGAHGLLYFLVFIFVTLGVLCCVL